ncbi:MAG TPA: hypothetical protein VFV50_17270 [Bdellovibrionales bacterium]|nr:hypothetical protein [Bdellovibrionales bacterium]
MSSEVPFRALFALTMVFGFAVTEGFASKSGFFPLSLMFFAAMFIQAKLFGDRYMSQDRYLQKDLESPRGFFLRGFFVDRFAPEAAEGDFLSVVQSIKTTTLIRLGYAAILAGLYLIYNRTGGFNFQLTTFLSALAIVVTVPVATPSHFMFPLSISALAVMAAALRASPPPTWYVLIYVLLLFITLARHNIQALHWSYLKPDATLAGSATIKNAFTSWLLFIFILLVVNWIFPTRSLFDDPAFKTLQKINKRGRLNVGGGQGRTGYGSSTSDEGGESSSAGSQGRPSNGAPQGATRRGQAMSPAEAQVEQRRAELQREVQNLERETQATLNPNHREKLYEQKREAQKALDELPPPPAPQAQPSASTAQSGESGEASSSGEQAAGPPPTESSQTAAQPAGTGPAGAPSVAGQTNQSTGSSARQTAGDGKNGPGAGASGGVNGKPLPGDKAQARPTPPDPKKQFLSDEALKKLYNILKFAGLIAAVLTAAGFLLNLRKKPKSEEEAKKAVILEETKKQVRQELAKLREVRLSPREEILKKYQLFLRFMDAIQHGKPEHTPPTPYSREVSLAFPKLGSDIETINTTFCDTLYGSKQVDSERLQTFNKSIQAVFTGIR